MPDAFDMDDAWENPEDDGPPAYGRCRRCGKEFEWVEHREGWRLTTPNGSVHACGRTASLDEFEEVPNG